MTKKYILSQIEKSENDSFSTETDYWEISKKLKIPYSTVVTQATEQMENI